MCDVLQRKIRVFGVCNQQRAAASRRMKMCICCGRTAASLISNVDFLSRLQATDWDDKKSIFDFLATTLMKRACAPCHSPTHEDSSAACNLKFEISPDIRVRARVGAEGVFVDRKLGTMEATGGSDGGKRGLPVLSSQDIGNRNKRKFLAESSIDPPANSSSSSSRAEFPRYKVLEEQYRLAKSKLESLGEKAGQSKEELEELSKSAEWKDPMAVGLEEIIIKHLAGFYRDAIKKVTEHGYSEEVAEKGVVRSGPYFGTGDIVENIVEGALDYLGSENEINACTGYIFEDFENLVEYTMLEMICVLREVNPSLSVTDAMWCLLMFKLDLTKACQEEGEVRIRKEFPSDNKQDTPEPQKSESTGSNSTKPESVPDLPMLSSQLTRELQKNEKERGVSPQVTAGRSVVDTKENVQAAVQAAVMEGVTRRGCAHNSKRDLLRQKTFHFEKNKGRTSKGAFKAKLTSSGSDKKPKPPTDGVNPKNSSVQLSEADSKTPMPMPQEKAKSTQKTEVNTPSPPKTAEYYLAGIPYDESQKKHVPQDVKDELILEGVSKMQGLMKELEHWGDWTNVKVMQVARVLSQHQAELKSLRSEKEETERFIKDKQLLEESSVKRLSEMEHALTSATGQIALSESNIRRLEVEKFVLKEKIMDANEKVLQDAAKFDEVILREQEAMKKCQSIGPEKALLQDELMAVKRERAASEQGLEKVKAGVNQFQALLAHEEKEKNKLSKEAENLRKAKERMDAVAKAERERMVENAKKEMQKVQEQKAKMEEMMSKLKLESEAQKIAELRKSASLPLRPKGSKRLAVFQHLGGCSLKQDRECVMCLTEEISVLFLPCAHQALCVDCNALHEQQGMTDCPSCRTPIQQRIKARYV